MGRKTLFIAVFIRPEQVVHFLLCSKSRNKRFISAVVIYTLRDGYNLLIKNLHTLPPPEEKITHSAALCEIHSSNKHANQL